MSTIKSFAASTLILSLALPLVGCGPEIEASPESQRTDAAPVLEEVSQAPDIDKLSPRAAARWDTFVAQDWIQAYDFAAPQVKEIQSLARFITGKDNHEYRNPSKPYLVGSEGNEAYLEFSVLWEPHHPEIQVAKNNPGDLTQELHLIETWTWVDGDWYWIQTERSKEFLAAHPNIGK